MVSFEEDVLAEFAVVNTIAFTALKAVARAQPDPRSYLAKVLNDCLTAVEKTNYWSVPQERNELFLENVKAHLTAITSIRP